MPVNLCMCACLLLSVCLCLSVCVSVYANMFEVEFCKYAVSLVLHVSVCGAVQVVW